MRRVLLGLAVGLLMGSYVFAQEATEKSAPPPTDPVVLAKLDVVIANQQQIMKRFDAIDAELNIIRVRASQKH